MAISIKHKDPMQILNAFGVSNSLLNILSSTGKVIINVGTANIEFKTTQGSFNTPVKAGALSMAIAGKLGPASKEAICYNLEKNISKALASVNMTPMEAADAPKPKPGKVFNAPVQASNAAQMAASMAAETSPPDPVFIGIDMAKMEDKPVPLVEATKMYQPVKGTSSSSVYHLVACNVELKIAARYSGNNLSLRCEGSVEKYKHNLKEAGFSMSNISSGYVSVHLQVPDDTLAAKTLGAIIVGSAITFDSPLPVLSAFKGVGH